MRHCKADDLIRSSIFERAAGFGERRASSGDVIDQDDIPASDLFRIRYMECVMQIRQSFPAIAQ